MLGLIFDMDGVLADTEGPIAQATIKMFRDLYGAELSPEDFTEFIGTGAVRYTAGPAEKLGIEIDLEQALEARHKNFFEIINAGPSIALPGAHALIDSAHADPHWKLAIATSSPGEKARGTLEAAKVDTSMFDAFIHADMVTHKKPHPEIYLKAIAAIGIAPEQCVVIEDAVAGVQAAKAAGTKVVAVSNSFPAEQLGGADRVVDTLEALTLDALRELLETPVT